MTAQLKNAVTVAKQISIHELLNQQRFVLLTSAIMAGSSLGFLFYNYHPAKIFMGDTGSQFLGFVLATVAIGESYTVTNQVAFFVPILILGIPIFDTILVIILRLKKGMSPFRGSPDHFAIRLVRLGLSRKLTVLVSWLVASLFGLVAIFIVNTSSALLTWTLYGGCVLFAVICALALSRVKT